MPVPALLSARKLSRLLSAALMLAASVSILTAAASAQKETTLYNFGNTPPAGTISGVVLDPSGNLYGVSLNTVFELIHTSSGWQESTIFTFPGGASGSDAQATPVFGPDGSLYGTTGLGGAYGYGTVYKLSPSSSGWQETVLYSFTGGNDGSYPTYGSVVFDKAGNLYSSNVASGATNAVGCQNSEPTGCGVIFELSPTKTGDWKFHLLHQFSGGWDGIGPAFLTFDAHGTLYGSAPGAWEGFELPNEPGLVFKLTPTTKGQWTDSVVYAFKGSTDGGLPGVLVFDSTGNIYGAGADGGILNNCWSGYGPMGCGVVFKISPMAGNKWKETPLYAFTGLADGSGPGAVSLFDGKIFGTAAGGGLSKNGVIFALSPTSTGSWQESVALTFDGTDGSYPNVYLTQDSAHNIFGTTRYGGSTNYGVVFEFTP